MLYRGRAGHGRSKRSCDIYQIHQSNVLWDVVVVVDFISDADET